MSQKLEISAALELPCCGRGALTPPTVRKALLLSWVLGLLSSVAIAPSVFARGADIPWITHEAEAMKTSGEVLGPKYAPHTIETESSHQQAVRLTAGGYVEFTATAAANALVLRYSLPDAPQGGGLTASLDLLINGQPVRALALTSRFAHLYGNYPFTNDPAAGKARNFYDELRVKDLAIASGDTVRLQRSVAADPACIIDLVDLENVAPPLAAPANAHSIRDFGAKGDGLTDDSAAVLAAVAAASKDGRPVWVPVGDYKLTRDVVLTDGVTIQGAGMWHSTFVGDAELYGKADRRVRIKLAGKNVRVADFAIFGWLNYRNDDEPNDGIVGAGCIDSEIARIWVEHTKAGAWIYNGTRLTISGCRFRNLIADGVNLCVSSNNSVVENCTARGTGDDCFAIWPVAFDQGYDGHGVKPGHNVIRRCTGSLTFLANGASVYGGEGNRVEDCLFTDIGTGCGVLISTTFPTSDEKRGIDNNFSGTTVVKDIELVRCGGWDHSWGWRGSFQLCLDRKSISGLAISDVVIRDSISAGLTVVAPGSAKGQGTLSTTRLERVTIDQGGLAGDQAGALWIRADAEGSLEVVDSRLEGITNQSQKFHVSEAK